MALDDEPEFDLFQKSFLKIKVVRANFVEFWIDYLVLSNEFSGFRFTKTKQATRHLRAFKLTGDGVSLALEIHHRT